MNRHVAYEGDKVRDKSNDFLPFVRYDTSAVPPQIHGGDLIYLVFTYSEVALEGGSWGFRTRGGFSFAAVQQESKDKRPYRLG